MKRYLYLIILAGFFQTPIVGQSLHYSENCLTYVEQLQQWYDEGAYLLVKQWSQDHIDQLQCSDDLKQQLELLGMLSESYIAMLSDADIKMSGFSIDHPFTVSGTVSSEYLLVEKIRNKDWLTAVEWFEKPHFFYSIKIDQDEWDLIHGYVLFRLGRFDSAITQLKKVGDQYPRYYFPSLYYSALSHANLNNLQKSVELFKSISSYPLYETDVPYYITQIYFEQGNMSDILKTVEGISSSDVVNDDLWRLAGLAAVEENECSLAIEYLTRYIGRSPSVSPQEYYSLGLCHYQKGDDREAMNAFKSISHLKNEYGQMANYYLADLWLNSGDKVSARNAFIKASEIPENLEVAQQARFYSGKLAAELRYDRRAIVTLRNIENTSPYYEEAQSIIADILINTNDHVSAYHTLQTIENKSPLLKEVEHQLILKMAHHRWRQDFREESLDLLLRAIDLTWHEPTSWMSLYWYGEYNYQTGQFKKAKAAFNQFLGSGLDTIPKFLAQASYALGYIELKEENYNKADTHFTEALRSGLDTVGHYDALVRLGDIHLKLNQYEEALTYYSQALDGFNSMQKDYALYQKAVSQGLNNEPFKKLITLESLIDLYSQSPFLDDALFEMAITLHKLGKEKDALSTFRYLVDEYEFESSLVVPSILRMGLISYNQGDLKQAADHYKNVFNYNPDASETSEALTALKEIYVNDLTRPDAYLAIVESLSDRSVEEASRDSLTYQAGLRQYELGNYPRAKQAFVKYLEEYPNGAFKAISTYQLAESALITKDYDTAAKYFSHSCEYGQIEPGQSCYDAAEILFHYHQNYDSALVYYITSEKVMEGKDDRTSALLGILHCARHLEKDSIMYRYSQKLLAIDKLSEEDKVFGHYCLGRSKIGLGSGDGAINDLNYVVKNGAGELAAESRYLIARQYYLNGEILIAERLCDEANKLNVNFPFWVAKGLVLYSDILYDMGEIYNARAALEAVIKNAGEFQEISALAEEKLNRLDQQLNENYKLKE